MNATPTRLMPVETLASEGAPIGSLEEIGKRVGELEMVAHNARNLAGLLETLSEVAYSNASIVNDEWQMKWWERAGYVADLLIRHAADLDGHSEAIERALSAIKRRGA